MRKPMFCICENKDTDQLRAKLISAFVFATYIVQSLYFLNLNFKLLAISRWLFSLICVRPGQNPQCWFSHIAAQLSKVVHLMRHLHVIKCNLRIY